MFSTSNIAFLIGFLMVLLTLINVLFTNEISPSIQRSEIISALTSISIIFIGFLSQRHDSRIIKKVDLKGEDGLYISADLSNEIKNEIAWGSNIILRATASSTILIYLNDSVILKRGLINTKEFKPGKICYSARNKNKYISLVNTKFYPGKFEFDSVLLDLPSVLVFPISDKGWIIIGGWSERCFTKSDEIWIEGWSRKLEQII